jgi:hypothetical protein
MLITAIPDQPNHNKFFESVTSQQFQKIYWFWFESKALYETDFGFLRASGAQKSKVRF